MDSTEIGSIIPLRLLRRINRLIKVDDVFADEVSISDENELIRENVRTFLQITFFCFVFNNKNKILKINALDFVAGFNIER